MGTTEAVCDPALDLLPNPRGQTRHTATTTWGSGGAEWPLSRPPALGRETDPALLLTDWATLVGSQRPSVSSAMNRGSRATGKPACGQGLCCQERDELSLCSHLLTPTAPSEELEAPTGQ